MFRVKGKYHDGKQNYYNIEGYSDLSLNRYPGDKYERYYLLINCEFFNDPLYIKPEFIDLIDSIEEEVKKATFIERERNHDKDIVYLKMEFSEESKLKNFETNDRHYIKYFYNKEKL
jgi:hypothetical protein